MAEGSSESTTSDSSISQSDRPSLHKKDESIGALKNFAALPEGYEGDLKPGHLVFNSAFESGNLGRVDYISAFEYDLFIRPDTCNSRLRVWFNFTVSNAVPGQRVIFNIVNFSKTKSLYRDGMSPLVKSSTRPRWQRIPAKNVFYYRCPDHRHNYVMSFAFAFDNDDAVYQFSYCFPYTYSRLQSYLNKIEMKHLDFFKRETLCLTVQHRKVDLITITSRDNQKSNSKKHVVFITSRIHPGETPSSYVCQGMIDFLISHHPIARILRDYLVFKFVPMLNPDGVALGNYRASLMGFDLNRFWLDPSSWAHPTIVATKKLLLSMDEDPNISLDFYIDMHAHSTMMNGFMYGNVYDDETRHQKQAVFPKLLCFNAEDFSLSSTSYNRDTVKAGTGRRALGSCLSSQTNCYTLEVSFFSYTSGLMGALPYTEESYFKLGRNVARTFLDYYRLNSLVVDRHGDGRECGGANVNISVNRQQQAARKNFAHETKGDTRKNRKSAKGPRKGSASSSSLMSSSSNKLLMRKSK
eukprot:gene4624-5231_t